MTHSFSSASLQGPSGWTGYSLTCLFRFWFPSVGHKHLKSEATNIPTTTSLHSGSKKKANFCWCSKDVLKQNFRVLPTGKDWAGHQQALLPSSQHCRICCASSWALPICLAVSQPSHEAFRGISAANWWELKPSRFPTIEILSLKYGCEREMAHSTGNICGGGARVP